MSYLILNTKQEAVDRTREAWEAVLGHKKKPEDVTEFLWGISVGKDGRTAIDVFDKAEVLSQAETLALIASLPKGAGENWEEKDPLASATEESILQ